MTDGKLCDILQLRRRGGKKWQITTKSPVAPNLLAVDHYRTTERLLLGCKETMICPKKKAK